MTGFEAHLSYMERQKDLYFVFACLEKGNDKVSKDEMTLQEGVSYIITYGSRGDGLVWEPCLGVRKIQQRRTRRKTMAADIAAMHCESTKQVEEKREVEA